MFQSYNKFHITEFKEWKQSHHLMSMPTNDSTVSKVSVIQFSLLTALVVFYKDNKFYLGTIEHYLRDILPTTYLTHLKPI
jgi:hypothetical protein